MKKHYISLTPLVPWQNIELPLNWPKLFGGEGPLEVEIGFGNGEFLIRLAQDNPEKNFVGIEIEWGSVRRTLRRIAQANLENVRLILADTRIAFDRLFLPQSLDRVYSLFPMPWPKEKHAKNRVFSHSFLRLLNNRLKPGGKAEVVTDHKPYYTWILEQVPETGFKVDKKLTPPIFSTKYEKKWSEKGQDTFYQLHLIKQEHIKILSREDISLKTERVDHFDPESFNPVSEHGNIVVEFKDFLYDPKQQKGMVRVIVVEDKFPQYFWIDIAYGEGQWYIHVARNGGVLPTRGVQQALDLVRQAASS